MFSILISSCLTGLVVITVCIAQRVSGNGRDLPHEANLCRTPGTHSIRQLVTHYSSKTNPATGIQISSPSDTYIT